VVSISACHLAETIRRRPGFDSPSESDLKFLFFGSFVGRVVMVFGSGDGAIRNVSDALWRTTIILFGVTVHEPTCLLHCLVLARDVQNGLFAFIVLAAPS
jgi:hypothetical protein